MSVKYDITAAYLTRSTFRAIHAGDDYDHLFTVERAGSLLNLTSATLWFTVKDDLNDLDTEAKLQYDSTVPANIEITAPAGGEFIIHLNAADTAELQGTWNYDIKAKLASGKILRIAWGVIEFLPNTTQASS
jgi:hypothetical protein